ncbi:MAG: malate dehydrogenase [Chloroflexota bacterium]|nr:malate dehydrogenase [Chloroflexota bacterium]MDE2930960.1 malate dehydrogenase [Chloroflexota bacterium]
MRKKVTIVGAGQVGGSCARRLAERDYADIVLIDIVEGLPQGKALDIQQAAPIVNYDSKIIGTNDYADTAGSDLVVITSGSPRKPGMSRDDLLAVNQKVITAVTTEIVKHSPECIIIVVTNPVDAMTQLAWKVSDFPTNRVVGQGGVLDSARYRTFLAQELGVSMRDITGYVLGGHGDQMVPLPRYTSVSGKPITDFITPDRLEEIIQRTRDGGAEIVNLLKLGSAYEAPGAALVEMIDAILLDQKRVLPCAAYLEGEYGISGVYVGVLIQLGAGGVESIVELDLTADESAMLNQSAAAVRELVDVMGI